MNIPNPSTPKLVTPWLRLPGPNGEIILKPGLPVIEAEEIGTREAAKILSLSQRRVASGLTCASRASSSTRPRPGGVPRPQTWRTISYKAGGGYATETERDAELKPSRVWTTINYQLTINFYQIDSSAQSPYILGAKFFKLYEKYQK